MILIKKILFINIDSFYHFSDPRTGGYGSHLWKRNAVSGSSVLGGNRSCNGMLKLRHWNSDYANVKTLRLTGIRYGNLRKLRGRQVVIN